MRPRASRVPNLPGTDGRAWTTHVKPMIAAAVLAVPVLLLPSAPADAACDADDRISHRESMCLRASWHNNGVPGLTTSGFSVQNMCPEYGTLVAKVDVEGASDRTLHLADIDERRGSTLYRVRGIYCCSDLSALCELGQADMDAGCLGKFERESSAARTCVNATASSSVSGGNRSCTIVADCERSGGWQMGSARTRITLPWSDVDDLENCNGRLTVGPCGSRLAARSVEGTPALSVSDARVREAPGASLEFRVTLDQAATGLVTVDYTTSDGTAEAGADYVAASGTLTFEAGETATTVPVRLLDDAHDEGAETLTLRLSNASGAPIADARATGTIANGDPLPAAWLARFGRTAAGHVADGVQARLAAPRMAGVQATLAGQSFGETAPGGGLMCDAPSGARPTAGDGLATRSAWDDALLTEEAGSERRSGSQSLAGRGLPAEIAFAVTADADGGGSAAIWGRGAHARFDGRDRDLPIDGAVTTTMVGADYATRRWIAGVSFSHSTADGTYRKDGREGRLESSLTGLYPYAGHDLTDRLSLWAVAGYGTGELTLTVPHAADSIRTGIDLTMAAMGARGELVSPAETGGVELALEADALFARTTSNAAAGLAAAEADASRLRLGLEGSYALALGGGSSLTPSLKIGLRRDDGDAETGAGVDVGGGIAFVDSRSGFTAELAAHGLLTHAVDGFHDRGVSGALAFHPDPSPARGLSLSLRYSAGASATGGADALVHSETLAGLVPTGSVPSGGRIEAEAGYGFPVLSGAFTGTPYLGVGAWDGGNHWRLGWRLAPVRHDILTFRLGIEVTRREPAGGDGQPEQGMALRFVLLR